MRVGGLPHNFYVKVQPEEGPMRKRHQHPIPRLVQEARNTVRGLASVSYLPLKAPIRAKAVLEPPGGVLGKQSGWR